MYWSYISTIRINIQDISLTGGYDYKKEFYKKEL